jgi:hypothetical protein
MQLQYDPTVSPGLFKDLVEEYCTNVDKIRCCYELMTGLGKNHPSPTIDVAYSVLVRQQQATADVQRLTLRNEHIKIDIKGTLQHALTVFEYDHIATLFFALDKLPKSPVHYKFELNHETGDLIITP